MFPSRPLATLVLSQAFAPPTHQGIDLHADEGDSVYSCADGVVLKSYTSDGATTTDEGPPWSYGERVVIMHDNGIETTYNHLSVRSVSEGEHVTAGQKIGEAGNTGYSFGPHLHFETKQNGQFIDPQPLLDFAADAPLVSYKVKGGIIIGAIAFASLGLLYLMRR